MNNLTTTGFKRKYAFWFLIMSATLLTLFSGVLNISDSTISGYFNVCIFVITALLGSKANDTIQKFKGDKNE